MYDFIIENCVDAALINDNLLSDKIPLVRMLLRGDVKHDILAKAIGHHQVQM